MELGEFQVDHFVFQFEHASHDAIQYVSEHAAFLWMDNLIVALLHTTEDLDVFDVECGQQLECGQTILKDGICKFGINRTEFILMNS